MANQYTAARKSKRAPAKSRAKTAARRKPATRKR
jgi:hypothetical protein